MANGTLDLELFRTLKGDDSFLVVRARQRVWSLPATVTGTSSRPRLAVFDATLATLHEVENVVSDNGTRPLQN